MAKDRPNRNDIICIGDNVGVQVNAYYGGTTGKPIVEIRRPSGYGSVALNLAQTQALMELLEEAMGFWFEEGHRG